MDRSLQIAAIVTFCLLTLAAPVLAGWPATMELGGFTINGVNGTDNADGSGRATGRLQIPGADGIQIDLARTASGVVTGSTRSGLKIGGVRIDGSFLLDRGGLSGTGMVHTKGKPISDANVSVSPRGEASGRGRVYFGKDFAVSVTFEVSARGASVRGSGARQSSVDTPLAVYTFKGNIEVSGSGPALVTTAKGNVERKGKIGGGTSSFGPLSFDVDPDKGEGRVNVGGTNITLHLW